jgi:pimeloyl-ACP methyl ester carboxylesterase
MDVNPSIKKELPLQLAVIFLGILGLFAYAASKFTSGKLVVIIAAVGILGFLFTLTLLAYRLKSLWRAVMAITLSILAVFTGTYLLLFTFVFFFQDTVANETSSFFQPKLITEEAAHGLVTSNVADLDLVTPDGTHLRGWLIKNSVEEISPLVIYFGGSGSESSEIIPFVKSLEGWSVALINYRGFGLSEGIPTHSDALADALFIYDFLSTREDIDPERIIAMGYSLGTGVAVHLSEQRPTAATVLISPFDHWSLIGVKQTPLYAPLLGIMKPYFNSISLAPSIQTPLLVLIGSEDAFVPPALSQKLVDSWGGETEIIIYPGENHNLLFHDNNSWLDILDFLKNIES